VLDDDEARAEIVTPITRSVISSTGLPAEQQPFVAAQVDRLLRDPSGARTFIDPFAGEWARMLGDDDPRPSEFDLAPLVDNLVASTPGLDAEMLPTDRFVVPAVPLPRADLPWMGGLRGAIAATTIPLALAAAIGFAIAFAIGDRRRVLRRIGIWAAIAGAGWVIVPLVVVWAARRWAPGADAVVAVALEEGVSGLRPTAIVLLVSGIAAFAGSFALALAPSTVEPESPRPPKRAPRTVIQPAPRTDIQRAPRTVIQPAPRTDIQPAPRRQPVDVQPAAEELDPDALWKFYS
jgi:hypothetical protein